MTTNLAKWASNDGQITKSGLPNDRRAKFLPSVVGFAYDLLRYEYYLGNIGLLGKADAKSGDSDGKVTVAEIKSYLQSEVAYQARRLYGRDQTPQVLGAPSRVLASLTAPNFPGFGRASAVSSGLHPARAQQPVVVEKPHEQKITDPVSKLLQGIFSGRAEDSPTNQRFDR